MANDWAKAYAADLEGRARLAHGILPPDDPIGFHPIELLGNIGVAAGRAMFPQPGATTPPVEEPREYRLGRQVTQPSAPRLDRILPEPSFMQQYGPPAVGTPGGMYEAVAGTIGAQSPGIAALARTAGNVPQGTLMSGMQQPVDTAARGRATPRLEDVAPANVMGHAIAQETGVGTALSRRQKRHKSGEKAGRYVGAPAHISSPQALGALRGRVSELAEGGAAGRPWYRESGETIFGGYSGDIERTKAFTGGLAITSPSTNVATNTNFGILAANQAAVGVPLRAGIFPGPMSKKLDKVLNEGAMLDGRKVSSFYGNILRELMPHIPQGVTADMWMARAYEMLKDKVTPQQFDFIERETELMVRKLNKNLPEGTDPWTKEQAQAAIWSKMKADTEGLSLDAASASFRHGIEARQAALPYETMPGKTTDVLPGLHYAPEIQKQQYHDELNTLLVDDFGNDVIGRELGALQRPAVGGTGMFEGVASPLTTSQGAVAKMPGNDWQREMVEEGLGTWVQHPPKWGTEPVNVFKRNADTPIELEQWYKDRIDPASRKLLDSWAATKGKLLNQDAASWVRVFSDAKVPKHSQDAAVVAMDLSADQVRTLESALGRVAGGSNPYPVVRTPEGYVVINPGMPGSKYSGHENGAFQRHVRDALGDDALPDVDLVWASHDGNYFENNWREQPTGGGYDAVIEEAGPVMSQRSATIQSELQPRIEEMQGRWANQLE